MASPSTDVPKLKYKRLGNTGLRVSELCLGAMNFGWRTDESESFKILDKFAEAGGNFIDTADIYGRGNNEEIVGRWLKTKKREDFVIATKFRYRFGSGANDIGASRKHILDSIEGSLKRLQTTYVDLYQIHGFDRDTPLEETLTTLNDLVRSGKVRYIGISNFRGHQIIEAYYIAKQMNLEPFICLQVQYNLLCREIEWEVLEAVQRTKMAVIPWSPLRGGYLAGVYSRDMKAPPEDTRLESTEKIGFKEFSLEKTTEHDWQVIDTVKEIASKLNKTASQVATRWLMQKPVVTAPIIGPRTIKQLEDNLGTLGWTLPAEVMQQLDKISTPERVPYPYSWESTRSFE